MVIRLVSLWPPPFRNATHSKEFGDTNLIPTHLRPLTLFAQFRPKIRALATSSRTPQSFQMDGRMTERGASQISSAPIFFLQLLDTEYQRRISNRSLRNSNLSSAKPLVNVPFLSIHHKPSSPFGTLGHTSNPHPNHHDFCTHIAWACQPLGCTHRGMGCRHVLQGG
jgi:hypothetical protein